MTTYRNAAVLVPPFSIDDVAGIVFGGFLCDKYINSQPGARADDGSPLVSHAGAAGAVPGISQPAVAIWDHIDLPQAMIACANKGKGWHLITPFEWASLAMAAKKFSALPHGGNGNTNPPSDSYYTTETAMIDSHLVSEDPAAFRALPGTGPNIWSHNRQASGVFDLAGLAWQWIMMWMTTDGYLRTPATHLLTYTGAPFGRGTISGSGGSAPVLTCDGAGVNWLKAWTADEFNGLAVYVAEAGIFCDIVDTTAQGLVLSDGDDPGDGTGTFVVVRTVETDITAGMTSGNRILTLRDSDSDLKGCAIPATSNGVGAAAYGADGFLFDKASVAGALRGGAYMDEDDAGIFALDLSRVPGYTGDDVGFRACKAT